MASCRSPFCIFLSLFGVCLSVCVNARSEYVYLMMQKRSITGIDDGVEFNKLKDSMLSVKINETDQVRTTSQACLLTNSEGAAKLFSALSLFCCKAVSPVLEP